MTTTIADDIQVDSSVMVAARSTNRTPNYFTDDLEAIRKIVEILDHYPAYVADQIHGYVGKRLAMRGEREQTGSEPGKVPHPLDAQFNAHVSTGANSRLVPRI
jgi:hypothetical protein